MDNHLKRYRSLSATAVAATLLLLPMTGAGESHLDTGATASAVSATARVNFKIIIPAVLSLHLQPASERADGAQSVAIFSNNHNVMLTSAQRTQAPGALGASATEVVHGRTMLSSAARKTIAENAVCAPLLAHPEAALYGAGQVLCTVSMP